MKTFYRGLLLSVAAIIFLTGWAGRGNSLRQAPSGAESSVSPLPSEETAAVAGTVVRTQVQGDQGSITMRLEDGTQRTFTYTGESQFDRDPGKLVPGDRLKLEVSREEQVVVASVLRDQETASGENPLYVADASLYRGTVTEVSLEQGVGSFTLAQAAGTDYGQEERTFTVDQSARFSYPLERLKAGAYVEVFYGGEQSPARVIASNYLGEEELVVYNGVLLGVQQGEDGQSLVMAPLEDLLLCGNSTLEELYPLAEIVFHCGEETQFYLSADQLVLGTRLNILHTGVTTRSLPPQGNALEVRPWRGEEAASR